MTEEAKAPTKVFISYSWDSEDHKERVLALANTLRNPWGIETDIDQYVRAKPPFTPSQGWDLWMEKRIEWAEFVLIVCTKSYQRRFRGDEELGIGRGSTWEGTIIRQHLYNNQLVSTKFIPIVFSAQDLTYIPIIFNGNDKYILEDKKSFRDLCYRLRKEPSVAMPEVATAKLQAPPEPKFFSSQTSSLNESDELDELLPTISEQEFSDLLTVYSDESLSQEMRQSIFDRISNCSWNFIVNQSELEVANFFRDEKKLQNRDLGILLKLLRKIASGIEILDEDLAVFFDLLDEKGFFSANSGFEGCARLIRRIIVFLLYDQPDLLNIDSIKKRLIDLSLNLELHWTEFWVDIYLRYEIGKIFIYDPDILNLLTSVSSRYRDEYSRKPVSELWLIITSPLKTIDKYQKSTFLNLIKKYAKQCRNFFECKWCIVAFQRVIPLMDSSEEYDKDSNLLRSLLEEFDQSLRMSPLIQSIYLDSLLRDFIYTRNIENLVIYEKYFTTFFNAIPLYLKSRFQLEYACCLHILCAFQYGKLSESSFWKILDNDQDPLDSRLLGNHFLNYEKEKLHNMKRVSLDKNNVQIFLSKYIKIMYRLYAKKLLENNHILVREFPGLTRIYNLHSDIEAALVKSLTINISPGVTHRPVFYAKSSFALSRINRSRNLYLIKEYVERALQSDDYSIIRNAKDLAWGLYSCYYYGDPNSRKVIEELADKLGQVTGITTSTKSSPKLHWAYYSGIKFQDCAIDQNFIDELYKIKLPGKAYQLKLKNDEEFNISGFTTNMLNKINFYRDKGSILAAALRENINISDMWNIIGTILFDNRSDRSSLRLKQAAHFYSLSKCFARESNLYDQKYCFNYIRCRGLSLQLDGLPPDNFYVVDTARYLKLKSSSMFGYKEDCISPYLSLLQDHWNTLHLDTQEEVAKLLNCWWIAKELRKEHFQGLQALMRQKLPD